ncbi:MAG: NAD-dependent epimerase/dehydratase family protein [Nitrososphaera sp.]
MLVTGGAGFVGRHLIKSLSKKGLGVIVLDIAEPDTESVPARRVYKEDIRNIEKVQEIIKQEQIDTCIHLAAKVNVSDSIINPGDTLDVNVKGTKSVLEACSRNGVDNFIFSSSAAVYGNPVSLPIAENHPLNPLSPYGMSKVQGEKLVTGYKVDGKIKKAVSLRFFNIYGEDQNQEYVGVIAKFADRLSKQLPPIIYGNGKQTRDFISVHDALRAIILAAESDISGTFNVGTGRAVSLNELAQRMTKIFGLDLRPVYAESRKGDILHSCADMTRTREYLHFEAIEDLDSGLIRMVKGMLQNKVNSR